MITKMHSVPLVMPSKFDEMSRQYLLRPTAGEIKLDARFLYGFMAFHPFSMRKSMEVESFGSGLACSGVRGRDQ